MNKELYDRFKELKKEGLRAEASQVMTDFLKSFASIEEKRSFTYWFFKNDFDGKKVRNDLYENVLFPALFEGYKTSDPWSIRTLSETEENLFGAKPLWQQIGFKTKLLLMRQYVSLRPNDVNARRQLLTEQINSFRYCEQEWPKTILYGQHEATASECDKILEEIGVARTLDKEKKYQTYIDEFETKLKAYRQRFRG